MSSKPALAQSRPFISTATLTARPADPRTGTQVKLGGRSVVGEGPAWGGKVWEGGAEAQQAAGRLARLEPTVPLARGRGQHRASSARVGAINANHALGCAATSERGRRRWSWAEKRRCPEEIGRSDSSVAAGHLRWFGSDRAGPFARAR